ncbi:MAG: RagB/SusD family nutrient uptake outer membrane protein [Bacteroidales bacterium]|nr:RagB/SusD family nutrient uptake outer membrane protein [Bacteroidales bacterium]
MKKNNKFRFLAASLLASVFTLSPVFTSCSDDDNDEPNIITGSSVVTDDATALALANDSYGPLQRLSSSFSFVIELNTDRLISFEGTEDKEGPLNSRLEQLEDTWYQRKIFGNLYSSISNDNITIASVDSAFQAGKVTQAGYDAAVGKVKLLRGLSYLYLVQLWGPVPVFTEKGGSTTVRQEIDDVYAQIIEDLTDAEKLLKDYDGDPRIPSKQAAQALLQRAYLAWGDKPLTTAEIEAIKNSQVDPEFRTDPEKLAKSVEWGKKVVASNKLKLAADFSKLFGRDYESNKLKDNEHLLTIAHNGDNEDAQGNHQTHCSWTFPYLNGQNGKTFSENHTEAADDDLYDEWLAKYPNDKRLAKTYIIDAVNPEDGKHYNYYSPYYTPINGKGYDESYENAENLEIKYNSVDRIEIRYAEVLLNLAEALVQLGNSTEAATYFNQLRDRAGIEPIAAPTFQDIQDEWTYEFTYEQKHLLNLYRWKALNKYVLRVKNFKHYPESSVADPNAYPSSEAYAYFQKIHKHLQAKANNVAGKFYRQPIPLGLSKEDLGIRPQNPGY